MGKAHFLGDTLAYIPTVQHHAIVDQLEELFKDNEANITEIYKLFSDAFVFIPCTEEEYRELEAAGLNRLRGKPTSTGRSANALRPF